MQRRNLALTTLSVVFLAIPGLFGCGSNTVEPSASNPSGLNTEQQIAVATVVNAVPRDQRLADARTDPAYIAAKEKKQDIQTSTYSPDGSQNSSQATPKGPFPHGRWENGLGYLTYNGTTCIYKGDAVKPEFGHNGKGEQTLTITFRPVADALIQGKYLWRQSRCIFTVKSDNVIELSSQRRIQLGQKGKCSNWRNDPGSYSWSKVY